MQTMTVSDPFDQLLALEKRRLDRAQASLLDDEQSPFLEGRLALRLGHWHLVLSLSEVDEIVNVSRITPVPGVEPWLLGVANLRGTIVSFIDLPMMLSKETHIELTAVSRAVVFHDREWSYGLLVDDVIGMRHFGSEQEKSLSDDINPNLRPFLSRAFYGENRTWWQLSIDRLRQSPKFSGASGP
jgi:twitching motility protein PilI